MTSAVLIYSGPSPEQVRLVASSSDPSVVARVADLLSERPITTEDPVLCEIETGRRRALDVLKSRGRPKLRVLPSA